MKKELIQLQFTSLFLRYEGLVEFLIDCLSPSLALYYLYTWDGALRLTLTALSTGTVYNLVVLFLEAIVDW